MHETLTTNALRLLSSAVHTMDELHFTGNCLKGSRPILSFDGAFDAQPHLKVMKELFIQSFGVPPQARKSKPFIDHVMNFTVLDNKVWIRVYQIAEADETAAEGDKSTGRKGGETQLKLVEIGPRFVLTPIVILESSFGGPVIFENKEFVSPNQIRAELRKGKASKFGQRTEAQGELKNKKDSLGLTTDVAGTGPQDPLSNKVLFG